MKYDSYTPLEAEAKQGEGGASIISSQSALSLGNNQYNQNNGLV